jgi:hypothetical protein
MPYKNVLANVSSLNLLASGEMQEGGVLSAGLRSAADVLPE